MATESQRHGDLPSWDNFILKGQYRRDSEERIRREATPYPDYLDQPEEILADTLKALNARLANNDYEITALKKQIADLRRGRTEHRKANGPSEYEIAEL